MHIIDFKSFPRSEACQAVYWYHRDTYVNVIVQYFNPTQFLSVLHNLEDWSFEPALNRCQIIQNRCLRTVLGVNIPNNWETLHSILEVNQLNKRREKQSMIFIYKLLVLHNLAPPPLSSKTEFRSLDNYTLGNSNISK